MTPDLRLPKKAHELRCGELTSPSLSADLWPQLFSDVSCIDLWISSEKILTRLYSVLHWFHKRLEANVKNPRENQCFQTIIVFSFGSFYNSNKCTVLWKIAARLITVSTSVNKEMWVKLSAFSDGLPDDPVQGFRNPERFIGGVLLAATGPGRASVRHRSGDAPARSAQSST